MFIDDAFIWIDGPAGSGKTTLIERVLESNRNKSLGAIRLRKNRKLRSPKEIKAGNDETRRFKNAGAADTLLVEYPDNNRSSVADFFFANEFRGGLFNAIYCEAELTEDQFPMDMNLFVLPPLTDPASIFDVQQIKVDKEFMKSQFAKVLGHLAPAVQRLSISLEDCMDKVLEGSDGDLDKFPPLTILRLAPGFEGLIIATKVIVNIREEKERVNAERLLYLIDEIGSTPKRVENTFGYFWRPKKSMFIANLTNPKDAELKKLVSMIKRKFVDR